MNTNENTILCTQINDAELNDVTGGGKMSNFFGEIFDKVSAAGEIIKALFSDDEEESIEITNHENGVNASW